MRKIVIFITAVLFVFYSCKKDTVTKSPANLQTLPTPTISANGIVKEPIGADFAGFPLLDLCSNEICTAISGAVVFYITPDGNVKPLGVYNLIFQDKKTTIFRGEYGLGIEPFTEFGGIKNIYKLTFNPKGLSNNKKLIALMHLNVKEDGRYKILIDSGTIECR